jgi:hypothetical protein
MLQNHSSTIRVVVSTCGASLVVVMAVTCGGSNASPTAPTPTTLLRAVVTITSMDMSAAAMGSGGHSQTIVVHLRETGGVAATVNRADFSFLNGGTSSGSTSFDFPLSEPSNRLAANSTAVSKRLTSTDENGD